MPVELRKSRLSAVLSVKAVPRDWIYVVVSQYVSI
jgi:hypothetical protein